MIPVLEIGGTHVAAALVDPDDGTVRRGSRRREPLDPAADAAGLIGSIVACGRAIDAPTGASWGAAIPGPFDYDRGIGRFTGVAKFESLNGVDVGAALRVGLAAERIAFLNDADAFVLGEWVGGAGRGHRRVVGLTLGTGIGSGFLVDGAIVTGGPDVPPGASVHRLTIDGRPLEDVVSRRAMIAAYRAASNGPEIDVREIADRARTGDARARAVLDGAMSALGRAVAPWLARFGATVLVVGGSMAGSWDLLEPPLHRELAAVPMVALVRAQLGDDAGLLGAARYARDVSAAAPRRHTDPRHAS